MSDSADKQFVVVENGQRASVTMSEAEAAQEAARRRQLTEGQETPTPKVEVKQNLCG